MLLVEVFTQNPPARDSEGTAAPVVPPTLPSPFFDIARNCLRKDPRRRWILSDIALGLQALPKPESHETQEQKVPRQQTSEHGTKSVNLPKTISISAIALILVLLIALPEVRKREGKLQPGVSTSNVVAFLPETTTGDQIGAIPATKSIDAAKTNSAGSDPSFLERQSPSSEKPSTPHTANPDVVNQVLPDVPQSARDTIRGTVRVGVRVSVDSSGSVQDVALDEPGPSTYFANLAVRAARQWRFRALSVNEDAPHEWMLWFAFSTDDVKAVAKRSGHSPHPPSND
jgi:TonB family protein